MAADFTWRDVLADWHTGSAVVAPGAPPPLAKFFAAGGMSLGRQNSFHLPFDEDGWSEFAYEHQGCCRWAYRTGDPNPDPVVHVLESGTGGYLEVTRLDEFLSAAALSEAVLSPPAGMLAGQCPQAGIDEVLALERVDLPGLGWPAGATVRYYRGPDVLGFAHCHGGWAVAHLGARSEEALRELDKRLRASREWESLD